LATFRDVDGLWNGYRIEDVCTPEALQNNLSGVLDFYNMRRREVIKAEPNPAHFALAELEKVANVQIITQNVDDLHERAGSKNVLHIHGEVLKARSIENFHVQEYCDRDILVGDLAADGHQLRPHICFFGETPYKFYKALEMAEQATIFAVIGTSLQVYPAAFLLDATKATTIYVVDPEIPRFQAGKDVIPICKPASEGVVEMVQQIREMLAV
jgi:NAD-dependent deacetylase